LKNLSSGYSLYPLVFHPCFLPNQWRNRLTVYRPISL
jgi:hypothetical protein